MAGRPPKLRMVVQGIGPVPPFNRDTQQLREEEAEGYNEYNFGVQFRGGRFTCIKRLGSPESSGGIRRIGKNR